MKQILYERLIQYIIENQDRFYRVAYSYTRHQEDALDAVQTAVCKALESYETIKNENAIRTWFYRILVNECLAVLKKREKLLLLDDYTEQEEGYCEIGYEHEGNVIEELSRLEPDMERIINSNFAHRF